MKTGLLSDYRVAVIGGGPAGLMAAEVIASAGLSVTVFERMPSVGRKLLMAGRGGLNITHSEPPECFPMRYGDAAAWMQPMLSAFPPQAFIDWCEALGQPTFIGSSGHVFPKSMKASPLLRAWLRRLDTLGVRFVTRAYWTGWDADVLSFADSSTFKADAVVLALGGASWPRLGADGSWITCLSNIEITPLQPANCGFVADWSAHFQTRHAGIPLKPMALSFAGVTVQGELMITARGIEGGAVYALATSIREAITCDGSALLYVDLRPDVSAETLAERLSASRGKASLSNFLRKRAGLTPVAIGLLHEAVHTGGSPLAGLSPAALAARIKSVQIRLIAPFGLARAISTAGGVALKELDENLMLHRRPGVFVAGEMLDWEAPTGGYLLQGCMATGAAAGRGVVGWLSDKQS